MSNLSAAERSERWKRRRRAMSATARWVWRSAGWLVIVAGALTISTWSLYFVARHIGAPPPVAAIFSLVFDGAAIYMADSSLRAAQDADFDTRQRFWLFVFVGVSAYVQTLHARLTHGGWQLMVVYASLPVIAIVAYDDHIRRERRRALLRSGKLLPNLSRQIPWSYRILFGIRTHYGMKGIAQKQWDAALAETERRILAPEAARSVTETPSRSQVVPGEVIASGDVAVADSEPVSEPAVSVAVASDRICERDVCDRPVTGRSDRRFCSDTCKALAARERKRAAGEA